MTSKLYKQPPRREPAPPHPLLAVAGRERVTITTRNGVRLTGRVEARDIGWVTLRAVCIEQRELTGDISSIDAPWAVVADSFVLMVHPAVQVVEMECAV